MVESEPEVIYIPGAQNRYDYEENVVVLDSRLKDYPRAHDLIKEHEFGHVEAQSSLQLLLHELRADIRISFGRDSAVEEVREYFEATEPAEPLSLQRRIGFEAVFFLRAVWLAVMSPLGSLWRSLRAIGGDGRGDA